ncbi:flippase [Natronococcus sp. A-GB7]|uniref:flippase n=1 Tax=Natronococcus sp. A-GB7 TaxID=3037649 RepID=UPI00241F5704|nr:flippase [Natronococcus sp. A-GB7]MDG5821328.1 flippase [Natronococcus sp. A-GB7]
MGISSRISSRFKVEFLGQILTTISGGLISVLLARFLDPNSYGLFFLTLSVFAVLKIGAKLGIAKSAARYLSEYKESQPDQIPAIIRIAITLNLATLFIIIGALIFAREIIADLLGEPEIALLLLLGTPYVIFSVLVYDFRKFFQGLEDIKNASSIHALHKVSRLFIVIAILVLGYGVIGALVGYILSAILAFLFGLYVIYVNYYRSDDSGETEPGLRRRIMEYSIPITATHTATVLDKRVDTLLVGFFLSPVHVGYYVIGKQAVEFVETPVSALGFTLSPTFGAEKSSGNISRASKIYETALTHTLLLYIPAAAGLALVAEPLIGLIFGADYTGAVPVIQVLSIYIVLEAISKITGNGLDFLGRARSRAVAKGISSGSNVLLNIVLIPTIGVVGAAIATVITHSIYVAFNFYIITSEFNIRYRYLLKNVLSIAFTTAVMSVVVFLLLEFIHGWVTLLLVVATGTLVWAALSSIIGVLDIKYIASKLI